MLQSHAEVIRKLEAEPSRLNEMESRSIRRYHKELGLEIVREEDHEDTLASGTTAMQSSRGAAYDVKAKRHNFQFNKAFRMEKIRVDPACYSLENTAELPARVVADAAIEPEAEDFCHAEYVDSMQ